MKDIKNVVRNVHTPAHVEADTHTHAHTSNLKWCLFSKWPLKPLEISQKLQTLLEKRARHLHPNVSPWFQRARDPPKTPPWIAG